MTQKQTLREALELVARFAGRLPPTVEDAVNAALAALTPTSDDRPLPPLPTGLKDKNGMEWFDALAMRMYAIKDRDAAPQPAESTRYWCNKCGNVSVAADHNRQDGSKCHYLAVPVGAAPAATVPVEQTLREISEHIQKTSYAEWCSPIYRPLLLKRINDALAVESGNAPASHPVPGD